jgi:hypothetical protein
VRAGAAIAALLLLVAPGAGAQSPVYFSPDITANLGVVLPAVVTDEDVARDDAVGSVTLFLPPGILPPQADVDGFDLQPSGASLLAVDVTVPLPGLPPGAPAEPRDVVSWDPVTTLFTMVFDGSTLGVPMGARIDAVATDFATGNLLLSFDTTVTLLGVGTVDDEDVVEHLGAGIFAMVFDGSANGVAAGLDLDAANRVWGTDVLQVSFDGSGVLAGVPFDDEDVLDFDLVGATYTMFADSSLSDPVDWPAADLVALPEPGGAALLAGAVLAGLLGRRRRSTARRRTGASLVHALPALVAGAGALLSAAPAARAVDGVIEINDASIVASGGYPFGIAPGAATSYVLTGNLAPPAPAPALIVLAPDTVIDLNGFTISGAGAGGAGVVLLGGAAGVTLRNGTITGFAGAGIASGGAGGLTLLNMRISGNGAGITGASSCLIVENTIVGNTGLGVEAFRCKIENNLIADNGDMGISGDNNVIVHNVITANGFGLGGGGVLSLMGSTIQENQINGNLAFGVSDTPGAPPGPVPAPPGFPFPPMPPPGIAPQVVMKNVIDGSIGGIGVFFFTTSAVIADNTVSNHTLDGIVCAGGCTVRGNTVTNNNGGGSNGGITVGPGSTVNDNSIGFNFGIGAVLDPTAGYRNNTFTANTVQDMSLFVPAAPLAPHPTSGFFNLCTGIPGPAPGLCP